MKAKKSIRKDNSQGYDIVKLRVRRLGAMILDWYLTNMIAAIPVTFYLRGNDYIQPTSFQLETYGLKVGLLYGLFVMGVGFIYYIMIPAFVFKGQTLGKKICHIGVVKENHEDVTFKDMLLREILGSTLIEGGIVIMATYMRKLLQLFGWISIVTPLKYIAYMMTLTSIVYAYFHPLSQCFHDKLAKTVVIKKS